MSLPRRFTGSLYLQKPYPEGFRKTTLYRSRARERGRDTERHRERNCTEDRQIWKTYRRLRSDRTEMFHARRFVGDQLRKSALLDSDCSLQLRIRWSLELVWVFCSCCTKSFWFVCFLSFSVGCCCCCLRDFCARSSGGRRRRKLRRERSCVV